MKSSDPSRRCRRRVPAPSVIGLTGPIAAGKSTVGAMLAERGAEVIDADHVYHALVEPGAPLSRAIADHFGSGVLGDDGSLDRAKLGALVFGNPEALRSLDNLAHPAIVQEVRNIIACSAAEVVVLEAIKLVQSGLVNDVDEVWLIVADPETRLGRLMERGGLDIEAAQTRIKAARAFVPDETRADVVIDTTGGLGATQRAVDRAWRMFSTRALASQ